MNIVKELMDFYEFMKNLEARDSKTMHAICKNVYEIPKL